MCASLLHQELHGENIVLWSASWIETWMPFSQLLLILTNHSISKPHQENISHSQANCGVLYKHIDKMGHICMGYTGAQATITVSSTLVYHVYSQCTHGSVCIVSTHGLMALGCIVSTRGLKAVGQQDRSYSDDN